MARVKKYMDLFGNYTAADDWFLASGDSVEAFGDLRDNRIKLTGYNDIAYGGDGKDVLWGYGGNDQLYGEVGNDTLYGGNGNDVLSGGEGNDTLAGEEGDDTLYGDSGNDLLIGNNGTDVMDGGAGDDRLYGGDGTTVAVSGDLNGNDFFFGGDGEDLADYQALNGNIRLTPNSDGTFSVAKISGGVVRGRDILDGVERVSGTANGDTLVGLDEDNVFFGFGGADTLNGNGGNDTLDGGAGNDTLNGGAGDDELRGGDNNDILVGDTGYDTLYGGSGNDTFRFNQSDMQTGTSGPNSTFVTDLVADFRDGDRIDLSRFDANASQAGDQAFVLTQRHLAGAASEILVELISDGATTDTYRLTGYVAGTSSAADFHITVQVENGFDLFQNNLFML